MFKKKKLEDKPPQMISVHLEYPLYNKHYEAAMQAAEMKENPQRRVRWFHLIEMFKLSRGVEGATLEAGSYRGMASNLICQTIKEFEDPHFKGETHFMVDSFEGLSEPVKADGDISHDRWAKKAFTNTSLDDVQQTMKEFPQVNIVQGWIPSVLQALPEQRYRFIHIDVDIYEPTVDCFNYFYEKLNPGGVIVCDDFGPWPGGLWAGCAPAIKECCEARNIPYAVMDSGNAAIIKR